MRSLRLVLAILLATAWGTGCGSTSGPGKPDSGNRTADAANATIIDAATVIDAADDQDGLPDGSADGLSGDETMDTALSVDLLPDGVSPRTDTPITDAPIADPDAPIHMPDADEAGGADDARADGNRNLLDAVARDSGSERARRDSSADRRSENSDTPSNLVVPEVSGTIYSFRFGDTVFAVDAAKGARIVTFSLGGRNVLTAAKDASDINWGSTFWTSPQTDWSWPPPAEIDPNPYTASVAGATLTLTGDTANALGLSVTKKFTVDGVAGVVIIEYRISNRATRSRMVAPWEISRVAAGGLSFFPMGQGAPSKGAQPLLPLVISEGVAWLTYDPAAITSDSKAFADGSEGWIAHATGDLLFVKAFGDITPTQAAPSEAEIELFANPTKLYIELENQGAIANLAAGATRTWNVRWFLRELDPEVLVEPGSADLLSTVRALVQN